MNINDYPVYYPYNATSPPYSPSRPHKGNDYALQESDPIFIEGTKIGLAGQTGWADGPHVHVQAGRDEWAQSPINPSPYVGKPGTVVKTGYGDQWGNYVCIKVDDVNVFYCHMSKIIATVGQEIGGDEVIQNNDSEYQRWNLLHRNIRGKTITRQQFNDGFVGQNERTVIDAIQNNPEAEYRQRAGDVGNLAIQGNWWEKINAPQQGVSVDDINTAVKEAQEALEAVEKLKKG